jgi:nitrogen fixation NifU-like protein
MSADINQLYDPIIKSHNANPFHFQKITDAPFSFKAYNPVCGDKYDFYIERSQDKISSMYFYGFGCAVSKAAGSLLVQALQGKTTSEAIALCGNFLKMLNENFMEESLPKECLSLAVVRNFPARYDCAAMACEETLKFLKKLEP